MARATRAVSSGMGEIACGCNDMGLLLLMSSFVLITLSFSYSTIILLLLLFPFANRVQRCTAPFRAARYPFQIRPVPRHRFSVAACQRTRLAELRRDSPDCVRVAQGS